MKKVLSLDFKVLSLVGLVVLLMTLGSLLLFKRLADEAQGLLFDALDAMAHAVHHNIAGQFYERYYDVQAFARNAAVQSMDPARIEQALNAYVRLYEIYDVILVTDADGHLIATNTLDPSGLPLNTRPLFQQNYSAASWFEAVKAGRLTEDKGKYLLGTWVENPGPDPYLKLLDGREAITNTFATAITDGNGHMLGVICNRAGVRWIEREFQSAYETFQSGGFAETRLELIDAQGTTLAHPLPLGNSPEVPADYPGTAEKAANKRWVVKKGAGEDLMVGSAPIKDGKFVESLGWGVRIITSRSAASERLAGTVRISYGLIFVAAAVIMLLAVGYSRRLLIARHLQIAVEQRTVELHETAADLEQRNGELEANRRELLETNNQLIQAQKELLETAKRLGQSEVAALTLHNIGNIITSLNIQSTLLREHMDSEEPGYYARLYLKKVQTEGLDPLHIKEHMERIEAAETAAVLNVRELIRGLIDNVRMAMSAITAQVAFVQHTEPAEELQLTSLVRNTISLYDGTFKRHQIKLDIEMPQDAVFVTERFRFESILTVLIRNAIDATTGQSERRLRFYTGLEGQDLILAMEDNGHGFGPEVAPKLFRFGFTTKDKGHGFGLHYAANSCRHLGIQLKLESPGEGRGATASLSIPRAHVLTMMFRS